MILAAGYLAIFLGLIHSFLGEILIFQKLRDNELIPSHGGDLLKARQVRILWASWHLVSIFGFGMASILIWLSLSTSNSSITEVLINIVSITMLCGTVLVLIGTKGKHPGWIVLTIIGILPWFA